MKTIAYSTAVNKGAKCECGRRMKCNLTQYGEDGIYRARLTCDCGRVEWRVIK